MTRTHVPIGGDVELEAYIAAKAGGGGASPVLHLQWSGSSAFARDEVVISVDPDDASKYSIAYPVLETVARLDALGLIFQYVLVGGIVVPQAVVEYVSGSGAAPADEVDYTYGKLLLQALDGENAGAVWWLPFAQDAPHPLATGGVLTTFEFDHVVDASEVSGITLSGSTGVNFLAGLWRVQLDLGLDFFYP